MIGFGVHRQTGIDAAVAIIATVFAIVALGFELDEGASGPAAATYVVAGGGAVTLFWRRQNPIAVLVVVAAARLIVMWEAQNSLALAPATAIALYTVARSGDRRDSLTITVIVAGAMSVAIAAFDTDPFFVELVGEAALMALPIAVGDAVRSRAERLRNLIDAEATARVQAERLRIARDLHDVVAHGLSTIAVQSGVAAHLFERDPSQAKEALEIINATGKQSLEELRAMVGVLRSTDDVPLRPTPLDPNDLSALLTQAEQSGVEVALSLDGTFPADVADTTVLATHRIIQEALTNVARHAGQVPATLQIRHHDDHVELLVRNEPGDPPTASVQSTGVGIVGMIERAESLGGSLHAGPIGDGGYEVVGKVPYYRQQR